MSEDSEFQVNGVTYRARKMSAFNAYDVARKWSYVLLTMAKAKDLNAATFARGFVPFTGPIPKVDNDFALDLCLDTVSRKLDGDRGWAPLRVNGQIRFMDVNMNEMLEIVYHVLIANRLVDFFVEPPSTLEQDGAGATLN